MEGYGCATGDGQTQKKIAARGCLGWAGNSLQLSLNSFVIKQSTCAHVLRTT